MAKEGTREVINWRAYNAWVVVTVILFFIWSSWLYVTYRDQARRIEALESEQVELPEFHVETTPAPLPASSKATTPTIDDETDEPVAEPPQAPAPKLAPQPVAQDIRDELMAQAGVTAEQVPAVRSLLFDGDNWRLDGCAAARQASSIREPLHRILKIYSYVMTKYGSWSAAIAYAEAHEGTW